MEIIKGEPKDIDEILALIRDCMEDMDEKGVVQWTDFYPKPEIFVEDLERSNLYKAMEEGRIIGMIVISEDQDKEYEPVEWTDNEGRFLVIHRMAVRPEWQRKGVGGLLMRFAEDHAKENDYTSIRLDTYSGNTRTSGFYAKMGYEMLPGNIHFPELDGPYYCFEKLLNKDRKG